MAKTTTKKKKTIKAPVKTIDQLTFARIIAQKYELPINTVLNIILEEQKLTMKYVDDGYKVIKKNYLTMEPRSYESKTWVSPLDHKTYEMADRKRFSFVNSIVRNVEQRKILTKELNYQDKIDAFLTNKWLGIPIFAFIMFLVL